MRAVWITLVSLGAGVVAGCGPECVTLPSPGITGVGSPSAGDGLVPTNARMWLRADGPTPDGRCLIGAVDLVEIDGTPVELDDEYVIGAPARALMSWRPVDELEPQRDYELRWTTENDADTGVVSFRTGDGPTNERPEPPVPGSWRAEVAAPTTGADVSRLTDYNDYLQIDAGRGRFVMVHRGLVAPADNEIPESAFRLGEHGGVWSAEPLPASHQVTLRFAALDLTGQISQWTDPVPWSVPAAGRTRTGRFQ